MLTLCVLLSLQDSQPTVRCVPMSKDMVSDATLACTYDPMLDCSARFWHERQTMVLTIKRWTP